MALAALAAVAFGPAARGKSLADIDFKIKQGDHRAHNEGIGTHALKLGKHHDRTVRFKVLFPSSAAYKTSSASHQSDSNKVMGISTGRIHETSVRLGWAWDPAASKVQLRFYGYLNGQRAMDELIKVPLDQWVEVELGLSNSAMFVRANAARVEKKHDFKFRGTTTTVVLRTAYFGGEETAPQEVVVRVKDIQHD